MLRQLQITMVALVVGSAIHSAQAFSMLGPYEAYQVPEIGYNTFGFDIGGPMNLGEEYRWNIKTITYGFDASFKNYFGQEGINAVNKAFAIMNSLPAFSQMSSSLAEFPTDTRRSNYRASALGLMDLKSATLGLLMEELGLASPDRYVWALRDRRVIDNVPQYLVIKRNFDPVTFQPSSYVNGVLYTYAIMVIAEPPAWDAIEIQVDPLAFGYTAVASYIDSLVGRISGSGASPGLGSGEFYSGLTRDDIGGLRYLYRPNNYNTEDLVPGTTLSATGGSPWWPVGTTPTNAAAVGVALRPGVDHITFVQAQYDSTFGNFITITNQYQDTYISNNVAYTQTTQRILTQPDILFTAEDLGLDAGGNPIIMRRTFAGAPVWINNSAINGQAALAGPGVINGQIVLSFSKLGPYIFNAGPFEDGQVFLDEFNSFGSGFIWGSFDGTTNAPIVYPSGTSIMELEQYVLGGN